MSIHPKPEILLPKDFEQPAKGGAKSKAKSKTGPGSQKSGSHKIRSRRIGWQNITEETRESNLLPDPPFINDNREDTMCTYSSEELEQAEIEFLEELDLNIIL